MATIVVTDASVVINSVDLSDHVTQVVINYSADSLEDTTMGATMHTKKSGLKNLDFEITFLQDYAANKVDQTLFGLIGGAGVEVVVTANAASGTNNTYTGSSMIIDGNYSPVNAKVGDLESTGTVKFIPASGCTFART